MDSEIAPVCLHDDNLPEEVSEETVDEVTIYCRETMSPEEREKTRGPLAKAAYAVGNTALACVWGGLEGMPTGTLVGVSVTGAGWWIAGAAVQVIGCVVGFSFGTVTGTVAGFVSGNRREIAKTIRDYRHAFGADTQYTLNL